MRILLLGKNGQLGYEANRTLACLGDVVAMDYPEVDFTRPADLIKLVSDVKPQVIYNAAAYTLVDKGETEKEKANLINNLSVGVLGNAARQIGAVVIHFSTDYVFDGTKGSLYTEDDKPNPLNVYGKTKLDGEKSLQQSGCNYLTFRTSWVASMRGDSFVTKVLQWADNQDVLKVVDDQIGNPTSARMLAEVTTMLLLKSGRDLNAWVQERKGIYHLAGWGYASRADLAREVLKYHRGDPLQKKTVVSAKSSDFPSAAVRPLFSALDCSMFEDTFGLKMPSWQDALALMIN